ncbi:MULTISPECIES: type II secretion system F family protein [Arthrobacter]|uniref:Type II secretion system protein F n=1 Tax=Arthrobacter psychrochitiniphilus TaxID=291045 RepID=A0A2V3DPL3_9MICC|nr:MULTISPECIES: type II secretion system F family protein [Arthrobacter]NYG18314.1 tight adherence protein B [Arthrobacter psychrochitiniphilus]PXA64903.1 type II secretion system protein F [Arthrobacter psychrochitiniphilus]
MSAVLGLLAGLGMFLIWMACWSEPARSAVPVRGNKVASLLHRAGVPQVSPASLLVSTAVFAVVVVLIVVVLTRAPAIALCFGLFSAYLPFALLAMRARRRAAVMRDLWPDVVDHLRSAIRAGLSLPEALTQLGSKGPLQLREEFKAFGADYRATGHFESALQRLKGSLADPVADRIIEALRLTRDVGGSDLGKLLGTLSEFLRDHARTRSELEARQSWTVNAARLAVAAPWIVLMLMATRPEAIGAYNSAPGWAVLGGGLVLSVVCYRIMLRIGALPEEQRVLQ